VSLNSQALLCEKLTGKSTLGFLHSAYAIGALFGVLYGGALVQMGESVLNILILLMFILTPLSFVFMFGLMSFKEEIEMRKIEDAITITDQDQFLTEAQKIDLANEISHGGEDIEQRDIEAVDTTPLSPVNDEVMEGNRNTFSHNNPGIIAPNDVTSMTHSPAASIPEKEEQKAGKADYWNLVLLCSLGGLAYTGEGSVGDWSTVYLVINLKSTPLMGVLGFAMFQIITAIARYCSDHIVEHVDRKILMQIAGCLAGLGLVISAIAPSLPEPAVIPIAIVGFGICGAGLSVVAPIVIHYAGLYDPTVTFCLTSLL
jgi:MFS family permease